MKTEPKPVELLQAQVALYAENQIEMKHPGRTRALLSGIGNVAFHQDEAPDLVTYPRSVAERAFVDGKVKVLKEKGSAETMFVKDEYANLLKDPANRETSRNLAGMISAWGEVSPAVDKLGIVGLNLEEAKKHPNFLGHGGSNMAFSFTGEVAGETKEMVALFAQDPEDRAIKAKVNERAVNLSRAKGLEGFEQGVAVSYDPPVVIIERAKGKNLHAMSHQERLAIPAEHWDKLYANASAATEKGIYVDTNRDNFIYDPEAGFTFIDFRSAGKLSKEEIHRQTTEELDSLRTLVASPEPIKPN